MSPESLQGRDLVAEIAGGVEPAQAIRDRGLDFRVLGPERPVAIVEALDPAFCVGATHGRLDGPGKRGVVDPRVERVRREYGERVCHRLPPDR
jgi:hypothetical protein